GGGERGAVCGGVGGGVAGGAIQYSRPKEGFDRAYASCMNARGYYTGPAVAMAPPPPPPPPVPVVVAPPPPQVVVVHQPPPLVVTLPRAGSSPPWPLGRASGSTAEAIPLPQARRGARGRVHPLQRRRLGR